MTVIPTREQPPQLVSSRPTAPARPQAQSGGLTGQDMLRILRKRKWLIAACVVIFTALAVGVTMAWSMYWPTYVAVAQIEVKAPGEDAEVGGRLPASASMQRRVETQERFVRAHTVFAKTADDPNVTSTAIYQRMQRQGDVVELLKEHIHVAAAQDANALIVQMEGVARTSGERSDLAVIVNAFSDAAEEVATQRTSSAIAGSLKQLRGQKDAYETKRENLQQQIQTIRQAGDFAERQAKLPVLQGTTGMLERQITDLRMKQADANARRATLTQLRDAGQLGQSPQVQQMVQSDRELRGLRMREAEIESLLHTKGRKLGPEHPEVLSLQASLGSLRERVEQKETELREMAVGLLLQSARTEAESYADQMSKLQEEHATYSAALEDIQREVQRVTTLQEEVPRLEDRIEELTDRIDALERRKDRETPLQVANRAVPPKVPAWPRWELNVPLGVFLGLLVGLGLAFLFELVDTSIKGPADLLRRLDVPVLGAVPHTDDLEEDIPDVRLAFSSHPNSLIGEAFRQIRTCLLYSGPAEQRRSLLITSPLPEDGRGTVTMNLAGSIASHGRKVLVVDANFRQPMMRELFNACPDGGLSSALVGQAGWREMVHEAGQNLSVMAAGPLPPNPAELLGSEQMQQILWEMREEYDQVLIDGAPCLVVTDSCVLGTLVDGVVLVVRAQANTAGVVQRVRDMLDRVGAHVLGVVLNAMRATAGGYLRKNYDTFYEYHEQRELPAKRS